MTEQRWDREYIPREEDQNFLLEAWRRAKAGDPQFVVLLAESGFGKTRLAQWLYTHLATNEDPEDYWPDFFTEQGDSLDVNPIFDRSVPEHARDIQKIPWFWWGIRFPDPGHSRTAASQTGLDLAVRNLEPHILPLAWKRQRKKLGWDAIVPSLHGLDWAASLAGLELPEGPFRNLPQALLGLISLGELINLLKEEKEIAARQSLTSDARGRESERDRVKLTLEALHAVLDPARKDADTVPMVLLLDDAHNADTETLDIVERLLARARLYEYPLLVLATQWDSEWRDAHATYVPSGARPERLAHVARRLGRHYPDFHPREILPIEGLETMLASALPGLTKPQSIQILERVQGNPLFLIQLAKYLLECPELFAGRDTSGPLTPAGEAAIPRLATSLVQLIQQRFRKQPQDVKDILRWGSWQGPRFLRSLVHHVASDEFPTPAYRSAEIDSSLRRGQEPHAFIENLKERAASEFRHRLFHEAANHHLEQAGERDVVRASVRRWLTAWLQGEIQGPNAPVDRLDAFALADAEFATVLPREDTAEIESLRLTALLGLHALHRANRAWQHAWEAARILADSWLLLLDIPLAALDEIRGTLEMMRDLGRAHRVGEILKESADRVVQDSGATPQALRDVSVSLNKLADVERALGKRDEPLARYTESLEIRQQIVRDSGATAQALRDVSISLERLADVELALGKRDEALARYTESLQIRQQIVRDSSATPQALRDVSVSLEKLADVELALGKRDEALARYTESLEICRRIVRDSGATPQALRDVSVSLDRLADVELARGKEDEALARYTESLEICRQIVRGSGATPQALRDVSVSLNKLADVELALGKRDEAHARYTESLEICRQIVRDFGATPEALRDVSVSLNKLADVELAIGKRDEALERYTESLEIRQQIVRDSGATPQALRDISVSLNKLADVELALGKRDEALARYTESLEIRQQIVREHGATPQALRDVSISLEKLADVELAMGKRDEALARYTESLEIRQQIVREHGATPQALRDVSVSLNKLAITMSDADPPKACAYAREALAGLAVILEQFGETPQSLQDHQNALSLVAALCPPS